MSSVGIASVRGKPATTFSLKALQNDAHCNLSVRQQTAGFFVTDVILFGRKCNMKIGVGNIRLL